jgi:hypothetical protein
LDSKRMLTFGASIAAANVADGARLLLV